MNPAQREQVSFFVMLMASKAQGLDVNKFLSSVNPDLKMRERFDSAYSRAESKLVQEATTNPWPESKRNEVQKKLDEMAENNLKKRHEKSNEESNHTILGVCCFTLCLLPLFFPLALGCMIPLAVFTLHYGMRRCAQCMCPGKDYVWFNIFGCLFIFAALCFSQYFMNKWWCDQPWEDAAYAPSYFQFWDANGPTGVDPVYVDVTCTAASILSEIVNFLTGLGPD